MILLVSVDTAVTRRFMNTTNDSRLSRLASGIDAHVLGFEVSVRDVSAV